MIAHEIDQAAGAIWRTLDAHGELTLAKLKKAVPVADPLFHWGLGWLAREDKIDIVPEKRSYRIRLK